MLTQQADERAAPPEDPEYDGYSLREIAEDIGGAEPSDQLAISREHDCRSPPSSRRCGGDSRYSDGVRTHADELLSAHAERVQVEGSDRIAAGVVVDQTLRLGIGSCDTTVRQPQCTNDEDSRGRVAGGEIDENSRGNRPKIEQWHEQSRRALLTRGFGITPMCRAARKRNDKQGGVTGLTQRAYEHVHERPWARRAA
ncbi:MAG: hypothetical protein DMD31_02450 [Gemmatimonadetes bacterium]|nr:MAG: hypothetical protein DMD31_02450 [Gemmatimonadota bacterium]